MKKITIGLFLSILLVSCARQETVDIGMVVSLSGDYSPLLTTARNGALLAVEELNGMENRIKLNLIVEDDESDAAKTISRTEKLLEDDFDFLILSVTSGAYGQVEEIINNHEVLAISPTVASDAFKDKDDNLIRTTPNISGYADALADYALNENKASYVIIFDTNNLIYAETFIQPFLEKLTAAGVDEISIIEFNTLDSPSFPTLGRRIVDLNPDTVLIIASPFDSALICQHIQLGDYLKLLAPWAVSDEFIENGGKAVEGAIVYIKDETGKENAEYKSFASAYQKRFEKEPTYQSLTNYDTINYLYEILLSSKSLEPADVKQAILDSGGYQGVNLFYRINEFGDCSHPLLPYIVRNGKIERL